MDCPAVRGHFGGPVTVSRVPRRIQRDVAVRGRDIAGVIEQYTKFVKPAFDQFVAPSRKHADIIIPWARRAVLGACGCLMLLLSVP